MTVNIEPMYSPAIEGSPNSGFAALLFVLGFPHLYGAMKYKKYQRDRKQLKPRRIFYSVVKAFMLTFFDLCRSIWQL